VLRSRDRNIPAAIVGDEYPAAGADTRETQLTRDGEHAAPSLAEVAAQIDRPTEWRIGNLPPLTGHDVLDHQLLHLNVIHRLVDDAVRGDVLLYNVVDVVDHHVVVGDVVYVVGILDVVVVDVLD
jgi:hypothetical protein